MAHRPSRSSLRAFSLVELLVVMAIIMFLACLVVPTIRMVRDQAKRATCQANLRSWVMGIEGYSQDYHQIPTSVRCWFDPDWAIGSTPYAVWKVPIYAGDLTYTTMTDYIEGDPRFPNELRRAWCCPTSTTAYLNQTGANPCLWMNYSYFALGTPASPAWCTAPQLISVITLNPNAVLVGDGVIKTNHLWYFNHGGSPNGMVDLSLFPGSNQAFGDGHVAWKRADEFNLAGMQLGTGGNWFGDIAGNRSYF